MIDRAEATGLGVAAAGHIALLAVLSLGLATATRKPPLLQEPIEVSFVEEIGLKSAVTEVSTEAPAPSVAPLAGPPEEAAPEPLPAPSAPLPPPPQPVSPPQPKLAPKPVPPRPAPPKAQPRPTPPRPAPPAAKPAPKRPAPAAARPAPSRPTVPAAGNAAQTRGSRLGKDFLKGIGSDPKPSTSQKPTGAVMSAQAMSSITAAIQRQIQPCANRQVNPGPGANRITVRLNLRLRPDGSLASRPTVAGTIGVDSSNSRYEERVKDLAVAAFTGCSPLRGLPVELYDVPRGWSNFIFRYKLPE